MHTHTRPFGGRYEAKPDIVNRYWFSTLIVRSRLVSTEKIGSRPRPGKLRACGLQLLICRGRVSSLCQSHLRAEACNQGNNHTQKPVTRNFHPPGVPFQMPAYTLL